MEATTKLQDMDASYARARTIKSYDSDRRKKLLAESVVQAFKDGAESASEAEHRARASRANDRVCLSIIGKHSEAPNI